MNHIWLIPVIAVGVWLLAALIRGATLKGKAMPPEPDPQGRPRRRPSSTEIDRFLEEVRRRQQAQRRRRDEDEAPEVQPVFVEPSPRPLPPPVRRPSQAPRPRINVEPLVVQPVVVSEVIPMALPAEPRRATTIAPAPTVESTPQKVPGHLTELHRLLRSPQGLRAALVVNEILGPPRCRRRRRS
jgi:hypothetical protein